MLLIFFHYAESSFDIAFKRSGRQFGFMLKPGDHLDSGIGPLLHFNPGADYRIVKATKTFESKETFKVAGTNCNVKC